MLTDRVRSRRMSEHPVLNDRGGGRIINFLDHYGLIIFYGLPYGERGGEMVCWQGTQ